MLAVEQNERFSITFRDSFERAPQNRFLLAADSMFGRKRLAGGRLLHELQRFGIVRRLTAFTAKALVNPVSDDTAKPGAQFGLLAQKPEMFPRRDESFLRNILALTEIANRAVSQRANQCLVARDDAAEGVAVAGQTARDKF